MGDFMIIIGINGNPGAGKTTASNIILKDYNSKVIHLDYVFDRLKDILPKKTIEKYQSDTQETKILNKDSLFYKVANSKIIVEQYERAKKIYANKVLKNEIKNAFNEGIDYLIIEGARLELYDIVYLMNYLIFINAKESDRIDRVKKRDKEYSYIVLKKYLNMLDNIDLKKYDFIIENIGTKKEFEEKCCFVTDMIVKNKNKVKSLKL